MRERLIFCHVLSMLSGKRPAAKRSCEIATRPLRSAKYPCPEARPQCREYGVHGKVSKKEKCTRLTRVRSISDQRRTPGERFHRLRRARNLVTSEGQRSAESSEAGAIATKQTRLRFAESNSRARRIRSGTSLAKPTHGFGNKFAIVLHAAGRKKWPRAASIAPGR